MICPFLQKNCLKNNNFQQPQQLGCPFIMKRRKSSDFSTYIILLIWSVLLMLMFLFFVFIYNKDNDECEEVDEQKQKVFIIRLPPLVREATEADAAEAEEGEAEEGEATENESEATEAEADEEGVEVVENDRKLLLSKLDGSRNIL